MLSSNGHQVNSATGQGGAVEGSGKPFPDMSVGDRGTDLGGPTRRLGGWQLNSVATDMTLQKESPVLFVTAGWYRGFILKNPNTKVRDVYMCTATYMSLYI